VIGAGFARHQRRAQGGVAAADHKDIDHEESGPRRAAPVKRSFS
jgi:hypothetical protein